MNPGQELSAGARRVLEMFAAEEAARLGHKSIDSEHILLGLLREDSGQAKTVLENLAVDLDTIRREVEKMSPAVNHPSAAQELSLTDSAKAVLELAGRECRDMKGPLIDTEHLLLGLIAKASTTASQVLLNTGLSLADVREETREVLGLHESSFQTAKPPEKPSTLALKSFTYDLVERARKGELDKPLPRPDLMTDLVAGLITPSARVTLLIGPSGVGKTALIHSLAFDIASASSPLAGMELREVDFFMLCAGTRYRGTLEERMKALVRETRLTEGVILLLNDFEMMLTWKPTIASLPTPDDDVFHILSPELEKGKLRVVGCVTERAYDEVLSQNSWLVHRLQPIRVGAPSHELTQNILRQHCSRLESQFRVTVSEALLEALLELSSIAHPELNEPARSLAILDFCARRHFARRILTEKRETLEIEELTQADLRVALERRTGQDFA